MKITRVINNNVVAAVDDESHELVLMGNGIGFGKKLGDEVPPEAVEKTFARFDEKWVRNFKRLSEEIPYEFMHMTNENISYAQLSLGKELNENVYIALADHLNFAIQRIRQGVVLSNSMLWEIKHYYSHEYHIGLEAIAIIRRYTGIEMPVDEAGFIAMHIISSELESSEVSDVQKMTELINAIIKIVKIHFRIEFDEDSVSYQRFLTHLKFFSARALDGEVYQDSMEEIYQAMVAQNGHAYTGVEKVARFIEKQYGYRISIDEELYLLIHIKRILDEQHR